MQILCSDCGRKAPWGTLGCCADCGGVFTISYSDESIQSLAGISPGFGMDRYRDLLPVHSLAVRLEEGWTPLVQGLRFANLPERSHICLKCEHLNPSGSFKDRVASLAVSIALEQGCKGLVTASSGNSASAMATYCSAAGLPCTVLIEPGNPVTKTRQILAMGADLIPVSELFTPGPDSVRDFMQDVASGLDYYLGFAWAPVNPYLTEALKTISYEIYHQLGGAPDWIVSPVGGGDMLHGIWKGWQELHSCGLIKNVPRLVGVQSESAPPLLRAFRSRAKRVEALEYADSRISGMNVPFSGDHVLGAIRESGGCALGVSDERVFEIQTELATKHGIWAEPAGAAATAALETLFKEGWAQPNARVVCICSGAGFKDPYLAQKEAERLSGAPPVGRNPAKIVEQILDQVR